MIYISASQTFSIADPFVHFWRCLYISQTPAPNPKKKQKVHKKCIDFYSYDRDLYHTNDLTLFSPPATNSH